jgi:hypothetical protein
MVTHTIEAITMNMIMPASGPRPDETGLSLLAEETCTITCGEIDTGSGFCKVRYSAGTSTLLPQYSQRTEGAFGAGRLAPQVGQ